MNNSIKESNSKEVKIQLKRAEVQKKILIKNIYKEYEIYFKIVRKSILSSVEKGIFGLFSELSVSEKSLNTEELNNFLHQNISFLVNSQLPLLTIEQLKLRDISDSQNQLVNEKALTELVEFKEFQEVDFDYVSELISKEPFEFHRNKNSNSYEYYGLHSDDELSLNLDKNLYLNSFSKLNNVKYGKQIVDSQLDGIEESKTDKLNHNENLNDQVNDVFISIENLNFFENIDKSFCHLLLNLSYDINSELFKINLINKTLTEDTFLILYNKNNIIKHPYPFVIRYILNPSKYSDYSNKYSDIYLFNISNIELEFYNLELSICRNNINKLKNRFILLDKKQMYWKNKEVTFKNLN